MLRFCFPKGRQESAFRPFVMWFLALSFFAYQFIARIFPGLCMVEILEKFNVTATHFGFLSSIYYFGYAGSQIPMALLLDRYGPRWVISLACLTCSLAIILFVSTENWVLALSARFLIGVGSAAGFLGTSKVISIWFPSNRYTKMIGLTFTFGIFGALYGGKPLTLWFNASSWEYVMLIVGLFGIAISVAISLGVKNQEGVKLNISEANASEASSNPLPLLKRLKILMTDKVLLTLAAGNFLMVGALEGFADIWGVPYFMEVYGFKKENASLLTSTIFMGMLVGGPLLATLSEKYQSPYKVTALCGTLMGGLFLLILSTPGLLSYPLLWVLMFVIGTLCCYQVLILSIGAMIVPKEVSGLAVAFLNCINMLGGTFFHGTIGQLMDMFWTGGLHNGVRYYEPDAFGFSLLVIPLTSFLGAILFYRLSAQRKGDQILMPNL